MEEEVEERRGEHRGRSGTKAWGGVEVFLRLFFPGGWWWVCTEATGQMATPTQGDFTMFQLLNSTPS